MSQGSSRCVQSSCAHLGAMYAHVVRACKSTAATSRYTFVLGDGTALRYWHKKENAQLLAATA